MSESILQKSYLRYDSNNRWVENTAAVSHEKELILEDFKMKLLTCNHDSLGIATQTVLQQPCQD